LAGARIGGLAKVCVASLVPYCDPCDAREVQIAVLSMQVWLSVK
jgi:hypothetical protein